MSYADTAASALADITDAGAAVTFSQNVPGTYDPVTDTWSAASTTTTAGYAVEVRGDVLKYQALALIQTEARTLLFAPSTYAAQPNLLATVTWDSKAYAVRSVDQVSPDGNAIISKVIVAR